MSNQITPIAGGYRVSFDRPSQTDFANALICADTVSGFTPDPDPDTGNLVEIDNSTVIDVAAEIGTTYYVRVALTDTFDPTGLTDTDQLNFSPEVSVTPIGNADTTPPNVPSINNISSDTVSYTHLTLPTKRIV